MLHSVTGAPVQRATVTLDSLTTGVPTVATTDAAGNFTFGPLPDGSYLLHARRAGFIEGDYGSTFRETPATPLRLTGTENIPSLTLRLVPQGILIAKVVGEDGEPVSGAPVQVMTRTASTDGRQRVRGVANGRTNDLGEFRAAALPPGTYYVAAALPTDPGSPQAAAERPPGALADEGPAPTFYPDTADPARAAALKLEPGQELPFAISIQPGRTYRVRGTLPPVKPGQSFTGLVLIPDDTALGGALAQPSSGSIRADGTYEISGVVPGSYSVVLIGPGGSADIAGASHIEMVDRDLEAVNIDPLSMLTLSGRVNLETPEGPAGPDITFSGVRLSLTPVDPVGLALGNRSTTVAGDGSFSLVGVPQGKYRLQASVLPNTYLKSIRLGEQDITKAYVDLTGVVAPMPLNLLFSLKPATLGVIVIFDSESAPRGTALFVPQPYPADPRIQGTGFLELAVDQSGYAQSRNMPPGKYRVYAFEDYDPVEGISEQTLQRLEAKSEVINVPEGGFERVNVKQIHPADIPR